MSLQMGLEGEYNFGASVFAAAADASLQAMASAMVKQLRLDTIITVVYEHISSMPVRLFKHLRPDIKTLLLDQSPPFLTRGPVNRRICTFSVS